MGFIYFFIISSNGKEHIFHVRAYKGKCSTKLHIANVTKKNGRKWERLAHRTGQQMVIDKKKIAMCGTSFFGLFFFFFEVSSPNWHFKNV